MHHGDEGPSSSGRPSLLSPDPQGGVEHQRILGGCDDYAVARVDRHQGRGRLAMLVVAAVAAMALATGAAIHLLGEEDKQIVLAGSAPLPPGAPALEVPPAPGPVEAETMEADAPVQELARAAPRLQPRAAKKPVQAKPPAAPRKATPKPAKALDNDVALLAALVTHAKATQPARPKLAAKLKQCKALATRAAIARCRVRACTGAGTAPACRSVLPVP